MPTLALTPAYDGNETNAINSNAINLSSVGSGTSHTLTAAFDGTNTKFKITHSSGSSPRISDATQLQVAINNVIQRPNKNDASFTEGYAVQDRKILFKTAPTLVLPKLLKAPIFNPAPKP